MYVTSVSKVCVLTGLSAVLFLLCGGRGERQPEDAMNWPMVTATDFPVSRDCRSQVARYAMDGLQARGLPSKSSPGEARTPTTGGQLIKGAPAEVTAMLRSGARTAFQDLVSREVQQSRRHLEAVQEAVSSEHSAVMAVVKRQPSYRDYESQTFGSGASGEKYIPSAPYVLSFTIEGGAKATPSRRVTLNIKQRNASRYRASENPYFAGASWKPLNESMESFELSQRQGTKTVYLQLKNTSGQVSRIASDSIILEPFDPIQALDAGLMEMNIADVEDKSEEAVLEALAHQTSTISIDGGEAYAYAENQGFTFSASPQDVTSECSIYRQNTDLFLSPREFYFSVENAIS
jgi:hypothetical protein